MRVHLPLARSTLKHLQLELVGLGRLEHQEQGIRNSWCLLEGAPCLLLRSGDPHFRNSRASTFLCFPCLASRSAHTKEATAPLGANGTPSPRTASYDDTDTFSSANP